MTHKITREYEKKMSEIRSFRTEKYPDRPCGRKRPQEYAYHAERRAWQSELDRVLYPRSLFPARQFGLEECARSSEYGEEMIGLAGIPEKKRIATRFTQFLMKHAGSPGMALLKDTYDYLVNEKGVDENDLVHEWAEGVIGDQYPVPDRILKYTEVLVEDT